MDEFFESMTLIQTRKIEPFPVILIGSGFWGSLVDWMKAHQLDASPYIADHDLDLFQITDDVVEAANLIAQFRAKQEQIVGSTPYLSHRRTAEGTITGRQPQRRRTNPT